MSQLFAADRPVEVMTEISELFSRIVLKRRPRLTGQPRPASATTYRIISAVGSRCEPSSTVRELLLIYQVLERIAAWRSQYRCSRAAAQQPDELSQPARDVRQLSHAFPST